MDLDTLPTLTLAARLAAVAGLIVLWRTGKLSRACSTTVAAALLVCADAIVAWALAPVPYLHDALQLGHAIPTSPSAVRELVAATDPFARPPAPVAAVAAGILMAASRDRQRMPAFVTALVGGSGWLLCPLAGVATVGLALGWRVADSYAPAGRHRTATVTVVTAACLAAAFQLRASVVGSGTSLLELAAAWGAVAGALAAVVVAAALVVALRRVRARRRGRQAAADASAMYGVEVTDTMLYAGDGTAALGPDWMADPANKQLAAANRDFSRQQLHEALKRQGYRCDYAGPAGCPTVFDVAAVRADRSRLLSEMGKFHADHIVPHSFGGSNHDDNCRALCATCNTTRGNADEATGVARVKAKLAAAHETAAAAGF